MAFNTLREVLAREALAKKEYERQKPFLESKERREWENIRMLGEHYKEASSIEWWKARREQEKREDELKYLAEKIAAEKASAEERKAYYDMMRQEAEYRLLQLKKGNEKLEEVESAKQRISDFFGNIISSPIEKHKLTEEELNYVDKVKEVTGNNPMYVNEAMNKVKFLSAIRENPHVLHDIAIAYPEQYLDFFRQSGFGVTPTEEILKEYTTGKVKKTLEEELQGFMTQEIFKRLDHEYGLREKLEQVKGKYGKYSPKLQTALSIMGKLEQTLASMEEDYIAEKLDSGAYRKRRNQIKKRINELIEFIEAYEEDESTKLPKFVYEAEEDEGLMNIPGFSPEKGEIEEFSPPGIPPGPETPEVEDYLEEEEEFPGEIKEPVEPEESEEEKRRRVLDIERRLNEWVERNKGKKIDEVDEELMEEVEELIREEEERMKRRKSGRKPYTKFI